MPDGHKIVYVGPEQFTVSRFTDEEGEPLDVLTVSGYTEGEAEAAAVFVGWIEAGFPAEVTVMSWADESGSGVARMKASDLVESAVLLLTLPLPMPDDLAAKVREYVAAVPRPHELDDDERVSWASAIYALKYALAWRQEHADDDQTASAA